MSRAGRRTLLYAVLLMLASTLLYALAVVAYVGFYRDYIPHRVRSVPVYLQYGPSSPLMHQASRSWADAQHLLQHIQHAPPYQHPFALADLRGLGLKSAQDYDISVVLELPRSPTNEAAGNVMVELVLATAGEDLGTTASSTPDTLTAATRLPPADARNFLAAGGRRVLFAAARPALLAYADPLIQSATRLLLLPYYLLVPVAAARTELIVPMAESVAFAGPAMGHVSDQQALPALLFLELRTVGPAAAEQQPFHTYGAHVVFLARLGGLRWFMYKYRLLAFAVLTTAFWAVEVACMVFVFVVASMMGGGSGQDAGSDASSDGKPTLRIKAEPDEDETKPALPGLVIKREPNDGDSLDSDTLPALNPVEAGSDEEDDGNASPEGDLSGRDSYGDDVFATDDDDDDDIDNGNQRDLRSPELSQSTAGSAAETSQADEATVVTGRAPTTETTARQRSRAASTLPAGAKERSLQGDLACNFSPPLDA